MGKLVDFGIIKHANQRTLHWVWKKMLCERVTIVLEYIL